MFRLIPLVCLVCCFVAWTPAKAGETPGHQDYLNGGYYLLHHLCEDESGVAMIMIVKNAPPEIGSFTKRISRTADESIASLDDLRQGNRQLSFDKNPLPPVEQDVRDSIRGDKTHQLLEGTTGAEFVRTLLVSQIEASGYAMHLSKVLAENEKNPVRIQALQNISAKWLAIRRESYRLLRTQ